MASHQQNFVQSANQPYIQVVEGTPSPHNQAQPQASRTSSQIRHDMSGSMNPDDYGSAEAMEYTPSNTSQNNNSIPSQLITQSNSNFNISNAKGSFNAFPAGSTVSLSPSPFSQSQAVDKSKVLSFQDQVGDQAHLQARLDFSNFSQQNNNNGLAANSSHQIQTSDQLNMGIGTVSQSVKQPGSQPEESFFDNQASLMMQQQRSASGANENSNSNQNMIQVSLQNPQRSEQSIADSLQQVSQSTTPGFNQKGMRDKEMGQVNVPQFQIQGHPGQRATAHGSHPQMQMVQQQQQQHRMTSPPHIIQTKQSAQVPHGTIKLGQAGGPQPADVIAKLQYKVREQAQRLQMEAQYRLLCEKRIRMLDPQHPLPVLLQHLERPAFSSPQNPIPQSGRGQDSNRQLVSHLQVRIQELTRQLADRQQLEQRLKMAEESLRNETLQNEEQRAYIAMLKDQIDNKIKQIGLSFEGEPDYNRPSSKLSSHNTTVNQGRSRSRENLHPNQPSQPIRAVDGLIQLASYQQISDDLKAENEQLRQKVEDGVVNLSNALNEQQEAFMVQIRQMEDQLAEDQDLKRQLNEQKETLLDYAKDNIEKQREVDTKMQQTEVERHNSQTQVIFAQDAQKKLGDEVQSKTALLEQVRGNMEEMRTENIKIKAQIDTMTYEKEDVQAKLQRLEQELESREGKLSDQREVIDSLHKTCETKEQQEQMIKQQISKETESLQQTKEKLQEVNQKKRETSDQNVNLKHTLSDSHKEMSDLVKKYERTVEELLEKEEKLTRAQNAVVDMQREVNNVSKMNSDLRAKSENQEKEIADVYLSLRRKEEILKDVEARLKGQLRDREDQCMSLQTQLSRLEQTFAQETMELQQMRRVCSENAEHGDTLARTLHDKDSQIRDLNAQLVQTRIEVERAFRQKEAELSDQLQQKTLQEYESSQTAKKFQDHNIELQDQNKAGQAVIDNRGEELEAREKELQTKNEQLERWQEEVRRLEILLDSKNMQHDGMVQDFDRVRSQKIDDALLIERMRNQQAELKDFTNTIVGKISNFARQLEEIGQTNLNVHVEEAYTVARKIVPATHELLPVFNELDAFIRHLSQEIVIQLQNLPERDSDSRSSRGNAQIAADATNFLSGQTPADCVNGLTGARHGLPRAPTDYNNLSNAQMYSTHLPSLAGMNSQHVCSMAQDQEDQKNFTLVSPPESGHFRSMKEMQGPDVSFSDQDPMRKAAQSQRPPLMVEQIHEARSNQAIQQAEIEALKNKVGYYQDAQALDSDEKEDLETALKLVMQIVALPNSVRLLIQTLSMKIKGIYQAKRDRSVLSLKLTHLEQKYHSQSRVAMTPAIQSEISQMMANIQKDRANLREIEQTIQLLVLEQKAVVEDILRANERDLDLTADTQLKLQRLQAKFEETCVLNDELKEQLEWTNLRLKEQQKTLELFKPRELSGERSRDNSEHRGATLDNKAATEVSYQPSVVQHQPILRQSAYSRTYSQEPTRNIGMHREESRDLEQYVASNPVSARKTPAELSEEFNRKQVVGGRNGSLGTLVADATHRSRVTELKAYQPETFGIEEQEPQNTSFTNKNRERPVSFAPDAFEPEIAEAPEFSYNDAERGIVELQTSQSQAAPTGEFSRRDSEGLNAIRRKYQHVRGQGAGTHRVEAHGVSPFPGVHPPMEVDFSEPAYSNPLRRSPTRKSPSASPKRDSVPSDIHRPQSQFKRF